MDIQIKEKENVLLQRKELTGTISFSGSTPRNTDVQAEIAKKLSVDKDLIVMKHIYTTFGDTKARFEAFAYANKEQRVKLEGKLPEPPAEEKKEAEKPAAAPAEVKEEPKAEEKKEEAPAEAKEEAKAEETPKEEAKE